MPEKDGPHAPHLAAMPGERKALVKATSSLESALLAVEARGEERAVCGRAAVGRRVPPRLAHARVPSHDRPRSEWGPAGDRQCARSRRRRRVTV